MIGRRSLRDLYLHRFAPAVRSLFFRDLISKTGNFGSTTWLGQPIWQNVLDLWTIQETIAEVRPALLIECGTNRGGSSLFFGHLFDLMGHGEIVTVDIERLHNLSHPRVTYLIGSSTSPEVFEIVRSRAGASPGPVMVILDSDHSRDHVRRELACYANLVTPGSYCLVQDGVIDTLPTFAGGRPGPLPAIEDFLKSTNDFELDQARCDRFLITHHPKGWLSASPNATARSERTGPDTPREETRAVRVNHIVYETRHGYAPRSAQEAFIVPLLGAAIEDALTRLIGPAHPPGARRAIDVGCGGQPFRSSVERLGYAYTSFDVKQNATGNVDVLGLIDQPLPPQLAGDAASSPFHLVLCTEVLEHVEDWRAAFANFATLLAPGGKLLVTCPHFYHLHEEPFDYWRPTPYALERYGTSAALRVVHQARLGSAWDVLGTLLACAPPRRAGRSLPGRAIAAVADVAREAAFVCIRSRLPHRLVPLDGSLYLSNLAIFERPAA